MSALRNPLVPVGLLLIVVGIGNWYAGVDKGFEHEQMLATSKASPPIQQFYEFDRLTSRTNASLLRVFERGGDPLSLIRAKLDFYRVVLTGGRMLILVGLLSVAAGLTQTWYRRRLADHAQAMLHAR